MIRYRRQGKKARKKDEIKSRRIKRGTKMTVVKNGLEEINK
jgi:hypothetical protein